VAAATALAVAALLVIRRLPFGPPRNAETEMNAAVPSSTSPPTAGKATKHKRDSGSERATEKTASAKRSRAKSSPPEPVATPAANTAPAVDTPPADTTPAADSAATPRRWQGIEVGTYIDPNRAGAERERLAGVTGLSARVLQTGRSGGETYHVVLGSFSTSSRAERMADRLVGQGMIDQAQVVPLGVMK
jgi:cell division protein FtsN